MKHLRRLAGFILLVGIIDGGVARAQQQPWSARAANAAMEKWPGGDFSSADAQGEAVLLEAIEAVWRNTVDRRDFTYIEQSVDRQVAQDGSMPALTSGGDRSTNAPIGRSLLLVYGVTQKKRYFNAATALYEHMKNQSPMPGGAEPFLDLYATKFHQPEMMDQIAKEFVSIQNRQFGDHPNALNKELPWQGRLQGFAFYMAALVDTIPSLRDDSTMRSQLIAILNQDAEEIGRDQDLGTGLWSNRVDSPSTPNLPADFSSSCMIVYTLAKGVRRGYLPESYDAVAERAYQGVLSHFVTVGADGSFALHGTESGPLDFGAFILASTEIENVKNAKIGRGDNVMVDGWFNSQKMKDATGQEIYFHYKWEEESNPGYSLWGHAFRNFGAQTTTLYAEPTFENLQPAQVYIIASPDNLDKNPQAHFANETDAKEIAKWVKAGGVLAIMENDTSFADLDHFNVVAEKFGMHFNSTLRMHVVGTDWSMGRFLIDGKGPIFHHQHTAYVKDVCTISVKPPAVPVYTHDKDIFMAVAKYGKGTVYAMVDPWFYNEYTNGLKLPAEYDNYAAGVELAKWLLEQVPKRQ